MLVTRLKSVHVIKGHVQLIKAHFQAHDTLFES